MIKASVRLASVALLAVALAGCQQTTSQAVAPAQNAGLAVAGFRPLRDGPEPGMSGYLCAKERCGAMVVALTISEEAAAPGGTSLTIEQALRADAYKDEGARKLVNSVVSESKEPKIDITSLKMVPTAAEIRLGLRMSGKAGVLTGGAIFRAQGNRLKALMIVADRPGVANRYLRSEWVP